jgi:CRP-like cAMP-binding protein
MEDRIQRSSPFSARIETSWRSEGEFFDLFHRSSEGPYEERIMTLADEMGEVRALRGLGNTHVQKLAAIARTRECPEEAILFREGDDSAFIFVLLSGEVVLEMNLRDRGPATVSIVGPGELLGWSPVLGRHAMTATARAKSPCRLAVLEVPRVSELIQQDPHFGVAFLRQLALIVSDRLGATRLCLASIRDNRQLPMFGIMHEGSD